MRTEKSMMHLLDTQIEVLFAFADGCYRERFYFGTRPGITLLGTPGQCFYTLRRSPFSRVVMMSFDLGTTGKGCD